MGFHQHKAVATMADISMSQLKAFLLSKQALVSIKREFSIHIYQTGLPIVLHELWIVALGIEEREAGYKHPQYGQFVEQLSQQTQRCVEIHRAQAHNNQ